MPPLRDLVHMQQEPVRRIRRRALQRREQWPHLAALADELEAFEIATVLVPIPAQTPDPWVGPSRAA